MLWSVGKDHRHRASIGEWEAEISPCAGRATWKVSIFRVGTGRVNVFQPYRSMRGARKKAERELERLNAETSNSRQ